MSDTIREQISALLDGELSGHEANQTLDHLNDQDQLRETWGRYHLIGDVIRGEGGDRGSPCIADRVREQLESEPAILAAPKPQRTTPAWLRPVVGVAMAASVAVLAIMAAPALLDPDTHEPVQMAAREAPQPTYVYTPAAAPSNPPYQLVNSPQYRGQPQALVVSAPTLRWSTEPSGMRWKNLARPAMENKLNKYLVDHSEYANQGAVRGAAPYAVFVGYDARR